MSPAEMAAHAQAINDELTRIETSVRGRFDREAAVNALVQNYPRQAVAEIAKVRGFKNLARIARHV